MLAHSVDITEENMNVFYELGYGHAKKRQAILLKESEPSGPTGEAPKPMPFDIKDYRYHPYEYTPEGFSALKEKLKEVVTTVLEKSEAEAPLSTEP